MFSPNMSRAVCCSFHLDSLDASVLWMAPAYYKSLTLLIKFWLTLCNVASVTKYLHRVQSQFSRLRPSRSRKIKEEEPIGRGRIKTLTMIKKIMKKSVQSMSSRLKDRKKNFVFQPVTVLCICLFLWLAARVQCCACTRVCARSYGSVCQLILSWKRQCPPGFPTQYFIQR